MIVRDGDWTLFSHDLHTGTSVWKLVHGDGRVTFRTDEPVDQLVKQNAEYRNNMAGQRFGEGKIIASYPGNWWFKHIKAAADQGDRKYINRKLNEYSAFKTFG